MVVINPLLRVLPLFLIAPQPLLAARDLRTVHIHTKRMAPWISALTSIAATLSPSSVPQTEGLSAETLTLVKQHAWDSSQKSWEIGTVAEALTEYSWPTLSVYAPTTAPARALNSTYNASDVLEIARRTVAAKPFATAALMDDGASGDPASIGQAILLANWTRSDSTDWSYSVAAESQLQFLLSGVPRAASGAISHRTDQVQLWADFVYMGPPFIAYYGLLQQNETLLTEAYEQCRLYREALQDDIGLWKHIVYGSWQDTTHWGTGNGWAAAGMMRVLATIHQSSLGPELTAQQSNLTQWVGEIITAAWAKQQEKGTLLNTIDASPSDSFEDLSTTALIAATTYRFAVFTGNTTYIPHANAAMKAVVGGVNSSTGWMNPVVDPYAFDRVLAVNDQTPGSPEGQSFVLLLSAAWRDFGAWVDQQ